MTKRDESDTLRMEFRGLPVNSGKVIGPVCLYSASLHESISDAMIDEQDVERELEAFDNALAACAAELEDGAASVASKVGSAEAEIFLTQKHIMNDTTILEQIRYAITVEKKNAMFAVSGVFGIYEKKFQSLENSYLRERASDIGEIRKRLLDNMRKSAPDFMCEGQMSCQRGENRIIVARELTVEMMARMNFEKVRGLVTEHGGVSSHAAIIARSLGIPAVTGVYDIMQYVSCGDRLLVDGDGGMVYLNPSKELAVSEFSHAALKVKSPGTAVSSPEGMDVLANASGIEDVRLARQFHADGIGLYRTEIMFLRADRLLDEDQQYEEYLKVADAMDGQTVTFRLIDVGGDKPLPFLRIRKENNPYLGWRGARFLLGNPDILSMQVRAISRVSAKHRIRILFPMIIDKIQQEKLLAAVRESIVAVHGVPENIETGTMFEVPSACMQARELFKHIDFGSIGTNDLIQYMFAVDRTNEQVSEGYDPDHPVLWSVLRDLVDAARESGKALSVCGEMAGRSGMAKRLQEIGIKSLSVSPRLIPRVRADLNG
jgi:phosphoenolpyruvate-protein phosphotransferase (PTS system enzyme I)